MNLKEIYKAFKAKRKKYRIRPISVAIDISNRCNAQCPFCPRQISELKRNEFMPKEMFYDIMKEVSKIKTVTQICLAFFGEPMLHPDFDEFVDYIVSKGYSVAFPTNMQLAHKHFDTLLKTDYLMLSIEGHNKEYYEKSRINLNFEKTLENVKELDRLIKERLKNGQKVPKRELNCLITKESKIEQYMSVWGEYADIIRIGPILPSIIWNKNTNSIDLKYSKTWGKGSELSLDNHVDNMHCAMPFQNIFIRANGKLALCCSDYDIDLDFGTYKNLKETYFKNKNLNKIRQEFKNNNLGLCKNCFQNYEIKKERLFDLLPELKKAEENPKVVIYSNR